MRLYICYARVDKVYCAQLADMLNGHDVWYDQRTYGGKQWWSDILKWLDWCEGFIYLLSPDSVRSPYCIKEYELARSLGRPVFPVLIYDKTDIPDKLREMDYINLSNGLTREAVTVLHNAVYVAERNQQSTASRSMSAMMPELVKPPVISSATVISAAATAMENGQFDQAVFLLRQAQINGYTSRFINLDAILEEAETALDQQSNMREAEREYRQIVELVRHERTREHGCQAFTAFRMDFPDYDPDQIADACAEYKQQPVKDDTVEVPAFVRPKTLPLLTWCDVPEGNLRQHSADDGVRREPVYIERFSMSKYPITNGQYQAFLDDSAGYANPKWWSYSPDAQRWRENNVVPRPGRFTGETRPRETVAWFDALAFCRWLGAQLGANITLPTSNQWQRAARGDDYRLFPWGNKFDKTCCNTRESELRMTTMVMRYEVGASPFGVCDLAGNTWEWCLDGKIEGKRTLDVKVEAERAMHGGSFMSYAQRAQIEFSYFVKPQINHEAIGFRVVRIN